MTLDLHVPKGWQMCTTRELEMIAEEMIRAQMMASLSRFHPFDWVEIKTRLFFRFAGVEVLGSAQPSGSDLDIASRSDASQGSDPSNTSGNESLDIRTKEQNNSAQQLGSGPDRASASDAQSAPDPQSQSAPDPYTAPDPQSQSVSDPQSFRCRKGDVEFELQTWQVHSFLDQLKWLDATDAKGRPLPMPKLMWPYPERLWRLRWKRWMPEKDYYRPGELLDGLSWAQYRLANDWMEIYTNAANGLIAEQEKHAKANPERIRSLAEQQENARLEVLAQLFYVSDPAEPSKVKSAPRRLLRKITEVEWQVIMFWWSSMMQYLKGQYPKCFKSSDKNPRSRSKQQPLPIELYTRSMATLQKYLGGLTEDEINAQTAHAILRHLNDMAVEAEEMEKIRRKHK